MFEGQHNGIILGAVCHVFLARLILCSYTNFHKGVRAVIQAISFPVDPLVHQQQKVWESWDNGSFRCNPGTVIMLFFLPLSDLVTCSSILCLSIHLSVHPSVRPSVRQFIHLTSMFNFYNGYTVLQVCQMKIFWNDVILNWCHGRQSYNCAFFHSQDGVIHHADTALRDFSAQCVREFLQWSIKQTNEKVCQILTFLMWQQLWYNV